MIRNKDWKYIHRYPYGPNELYDLVNDPEERVNRIDDPDTADIVIRMREELKAWFLQYVNPELDATHEEITGSGQIGLVHGGKQAFNKANGLDKLLARQLLAEK